LSPSFRPDGNYLDFIRGPGRPAALLVTTFIRPFRQHSLNCIAFDLDFFLAIFREVANKKANIRTTVNLRLTSAFGKSRLMETDYIMRFIHFTQLL